MLSTRIAIIGASIVGSACAILLARAGFNVTIFEQRKRGAIDDLGIGFAMPCELIETLKERKLLDVEFSPLTIKHRELYAYNRDTKQTRLLLSHTANFNTVNWSLLYKQLEKRLHQEKIKYKYNYKLTSVDYSEPFVKLLFSNNGEENEFDYVIFADGYKSLGRIFLFPDTTTNFSGYIAWRNKYTTTDANHIEQLRNHQPIYGHSSGIAFAYLIPSNHEDIYTVNSLIYEKITDKHPLFKGDIKLADRNIASNLLPKSYLDYYHDLIMTELPDLWYEFFLNGSPFVQTIQDVIIDTYYRKRMALIGDASTLLRPMTGSGATKGLQDALALIDELTKINDIESAFNNWGKTRADAAKHLFNLGKELSNFYVMEHPVWDTVTPAEISEIWGNITNHINWYITKN